MSSGERDLSRLVTEQRLILQEMERLYSEIALLERAIAERQMALASLNEYKNAEEEKETLVPIGGNVYIPSKLVPKKSLLVGVGAGIYVAKSVDDAINFINEALAKLNRAHRERLAALENLRRRYDEITAMIAELRMREEARGQRQPGQQPMS